MANFQDYNLNFSKDLVSDFINEQTPLFIRGQYPKFIDFVKSYFRFLESNMVELYISSDTPLLGDLQIGESVSSVHCLMCEDGITYLGGGTLEDPLIELDGYRNDLNELVHPDRIMGTSLGSIDIDNVSIGDNIVRKKLIINHTGGSIENLITSGDLGEIFSPTLLNSISNTANTLPTLFSFVEIRTPIYALNNLHNYTDIDFTFNNALFLGDKYYALLVKEIMRDWPKILASPTEEISKAIVGRNIKDFYKSKGTEDSIKFLFRVLYGKEAEIFSPPDHMFYMNDGRWITDFTLVVEKDIDGHILNAENRVIYNTANTSHYAFIESVTPQANTQLITLSVSNAFGEFDFGSSISGSLLSGEEFVCPIYTSLISTSLYASNRGLLNGGPEAPLPAGHTTWDDLSLTSEALALVSPDFTDRIQDSYYYQLFSYVIRTNLDRSLFPEAEANLLKMTHPAGFKMFIESL